MKAVVMEDIGEIVVKEVPRPKVEAGGILVSVKACAICGSDVRTIEHGSSVSSLHAFWGTRLQEL